MTTPFDDKCPIGTVFKSPGGYWKTTVTGGIACGKSTFLEVARRMGYNCIDADEWFHKFRRTPNEKSFATQMFGEKYAESGWLSEVAFVHPNWAKYEEFIDFSFIHYLATQQVVHNVNYDIVVNGSNL